MSDILTIILGIGAIQSFLFALLIVLKKRRKLADWILMGWFLIFSFHLLLGSAEGLDSRNTKAILITTISFLHGPFFLLYAKAIFKQGIGKVDFLHFSPFVVFVLASFFIGKPSELQWEILILIAKLISLTSYPLYILYTYQKKIAFFKANSADNGILEFSWIRVIAILFLVSTGISMVRLTTELMVGVAYFRVLDALRYVVLVTVIGFYGLKYGMVYRPEMNIDVVPDEKKYKHSPLKRDKIQMFIQHIDRFFQENEAYLHPNFSLSVLSESLRIPKHHLSQIINSEMETTFYDLVNIKRVEYAMLRIKRGDMGNLTLEGLGYECGFNSKSAFFHHFKKNTGKTPGQFKKEIGVD